MKASLFFFMKQLGGANLFHFYGLHTEVSSSNSTS